MKKNNVAETLVANPVEELLLRAVVDSEFRSELLANPEAFGISRNTENLVLPQSVTQQDMSFVELINDAIFACKNTCSSGFTISCDGNTQADSSECKCTCSAGLTIRCDGSSM